MTSHEFCMLCGAAGGVRDVQSIISDYFGDQDPRVRTAALKAMVRDLNLLKPDTGTTLHAQVLSSFCALLFVLQLQLHERGMKIYQIIYDQVTALYLYWTVSVLLHYSGTRLACIVCLQACRLLSDDYEQVRSAAVQMVWVLSQLYPER